MQGSLFLYGNGLLIIMNQTQTPLKYLFQQEFSKMVAVISKRFGLKHIELAEDIVSETFLTAADTWGIKSVPENPTAWLYAVAKQKCLYQFRREKIYEDKVLPQLNRDAETTDALSDEDFSQANIRDSELRMLFAVCHPAIASEAQIGLALRILCGFGIDEIAEAFLSNKETINKRLFRAKEKLRTEKIDLEVGSGDDLVRRLDNVLHIIYLLFNEGYYSTTQNQNLRHELCYEAMRLALMLTNHHPTSLPKTHALTALMCFHASRFSARQTNENDMVLYDDQDEDCWDHQLIAQGFHHLGLSAAGDEMSSYHLEAKIASYHCTKEETPEKWEDILGFYDQLLTINYSPVVALNRAFAVYKAKGRLAGIKEAEHLRLENNHFYFLLLGELYTPIDKPKAKLNFERAQALAKTQVEKQGIQHKIDSLTD